MAEERKSAGDRIKDQYIPGLFIILTAGWIAWVSTQVISLSSKVSTHETELNEIDWSNVKDQETGLKAAKCFIYKQERSKFFARCIADNGEIQPDTSCRVGTEYRTFDDPLPQIPGVCQ